MAPPTLLLLLLLLLSTSSISTAYQHCHRRHHFLAPPPAPASNNSRPTPISAACSGALYPILCTRTLSSSPLPTSTPADLARAAVSAALSCTRAARGFLSGLPASPALADCREQLGDSVNDLARTKVELSRLRPATFRWQLDNALTWASAAMTNEDTCLDAVGKGEGGGAPTSRAEVLKRVTRVSRVTSNALYLINRLASTRGRRI